MKKNKQHGFTLIEILVVISIVAIVFGFVVTAAARAQKEARDAQRKSDLKKIQQALQQYYTDQGFYPSSESDLAMGYGSTSTRMMSLDVMINGLTSCNGRHSPCPVAPEILKTYLMPIPQEPAPIIITPPYADNHYCYEAWQDRSMANHCNTAAAPGDCHYYRIFARLETSTAPAMTCNDASEPHDEQNYYVDVDSDFKL